jgi:hypothetical protein
MQKRTEVKVLVLAVAAALNAIAAMHVAYADQTITGSTTSVTISSDQDTVVNNGTVVSDVSGGSNGLTNYFSTINYLSNSADKLIYGSLTALSNIGQINTISNSGAISGGRNGVSNQAR